MAENTNGWIKLHRSLQGKGWAKKPDYLAVWVHLLFEAEHKKVEKFWNGKSITLHPGQLITGRLKIAENSGVHQSTVERVLKCFENEQQIEQQKSSTSRLITILNYKKFQVGEQQIEQRLNNKRTTAEQRLNTINKNIKNTRSKELSIIPQAEVFFEKFWDLYAKKISRDKCHAKFLKLSNAEIDTIFKTLPDYVLSTPEIKYRKNPETYLNNKSWNDAIILSSNGTEPPQPTKQQSAEIEKKHADFYESQRG